MGTVWSGDWNDRISQRLESRGYNSIRDLLRAREGRSYEDLAAELGSDVAPAQIVIAHLQQSAEDGCFLEAAADCLARALIAQLGQGWGRGVRAEYRTASALAEWYADVSHTSQVEIDAAALDRVKTALREVVRPPDGWLPRNGRDPLIREAFRMAGATLPASRGDDGQDGTS